MIHCKECRYWYPPKTETHGVCGLAECEGDWEGRHDPLPPMYLSDNGSLLTTPNHGCEAGQINGELRTASGLRDVYNDRLQQLVSVTREMNEAEQKEQKTRWRTVRDRALLLKPEQPIPMSQAEYEAINKLYPPRPKYANIQKYPHHIEFMGHRVQIEK